MSDVGMPKLVSPFWIIEGPHISHAGVRASAYPFRT